MHAHTHTHPYTHKHTHTHAHTHAHTHQRTLMHTHTVVQVGFQATQYTFLEDEGSAHICVQLMQGSHCRRPVVVRVHTRECGEGVNYADGESIHNWP